MGFRIVLLALAPVGCHLVFSHEPGGAGVTPDLLQAERRMSELGAVRDRGSDPREGLGPRDSARAPGPILDPSFAKTGFVTIDGAFSDEDYAAGAAIDLAGRLVVVGMVTTSFTAPNKYNKDAAVWRFLPDGAPDPSFGGAGEVRLQLGNWDWARNLALEPGDKIVVGGNVDNTFDRPAAWRLDAGGKLDPAFGSAGRSLLQAASAEVQGTDLARDPGSGEYLLLGNQYDNWLVVGKLTASGALQKSFASVGYLKLDALARSFGARLRIDGGGRVVVAGWGRPVGAAAGTDLAVWRLTSTGQLDAAFAGTGYRLEGASDGDEAAADLELDATENIFACGVAKKQLAVWKLRVDGSLDPGYGVQGVVLDLAGGVEAAAGACRLDESGRLVVAGTSTGADGAARLTVWRLLPSGVLDASLGGKGYATIDAFTGKDPHVRSLTLAKDRAVVCGHLGSGASSDAVILKLVLP